MSQPKIRSKRVAFALGVTFFLAGSWFLYQTWEARGQKTPRAARPFIWF